MKIIINYLILKKAIKKIIKEKYKFTNYKINNITVKNKNNIEIEIIILDSYSFDIDFFIFEITKKELKKGIKKVYNYE